jgi:hypothetical protein
VLRRFQVAPGIKPGLPAGHPALAHLSDTRFLGPVPQLLQVSELPEPRNATRKRLGLSVTVGHRLGFPPLVDLQKLPPYED